MKKVLLLGAMGFVGSNLITTLSENYHIILYDRIKDIPDKYKNIEYLYGDFQSEKRWDDILYQVDIIIHLICTTNVGSGTDHIEQEICENVIPTIRLLEAMKNRGTKRMIFMSSGGTVYGEGSVYPIPERSSQVPACPYGVQKMTIEAYLELYNQLYQMENIILRVANPYGIGQKEGRTQGIIPIFLKAFIEQRPICVYGDGQNIRDYIYMEDLTEAIKCIMEYQGKMRVFNVGTGRGYSIKDVIHLIEGEIGIPSPEIKYLPKRKGDVRKNILDSSLIRKETGWYAQTDLSKGIGLLYRKLIHEEDYECE